MKRFLCCAVAAAAVIALHGTADAQKPYSILAHWKIGGTGGWDYLVADASAHRLYVTHGTRVEVLNTETGEMIGAVTGLKGTHGVALDDTGEFGYISNGGANTIVVFDRKTLATVAAIPAGANPDSITFDPTTRTVWTFNGHSNSATVLDPKSRKVIATIALPGKPEFAQPDGRGQIFVNIEDKNSIAVLDGRSRKLVSVWELSDCKSPSGLAIDSEHERLFAVCDEKKMAVVDAKLGKQIATATIGDDPDAAGFDNKDQLAFASTADGFLSVVDTRKNYKTIESLPTTKGARTMVYDASKDRLYVVSAEMGARAAATSTNPKPRPSIMPGTFQVLVIGRK